MPSVRLSQTPAGKNDTPDRALWSFSADSCADSRCEILEFCIRCVLGNRGNAVVPPNHTTLVHLALANYLAISCLQDEIGIPIFTLPLVEAPWLDTVFAHALDTILSTRLGLVAFRLEDDLAVAGFQAEIILATFFGLKKLERSRTWSHCLEIRGDRASRE